MRISPISPPPVPRGTPCATSRPGRRSPATIANLTSASRAFPEPRLRRVMEESQELEVEMAVDFLQQGGGELRQVSAGQIVVAVHGAAQPGIGADPVLDRLQRGACPCQTQFSLQPF